MTCYLLGSTGRLGGALCRVKARAPVHVIDRSVSAEWFSSGGADAVTRHLEKFVEPDSDILVAVGLTDPSSPEEELRQVNFELPKNIILGADRLGIRTVTFGTVMERLNGSCNPYHRTKRLLGHYAEEAVASGKRVLHLRLHTLFGGGAPAQFMFLGQIIQAIRTNSVFKMTSGRQVREYHHVDDEVLAIRALMASRGSEVIDLSHGESVTLKTIARSIFSSTNSLHLLRLGELPDSPTEIYKNFDVPSQFDEFISFRKTIPSVVGDVSQYLNVRYLRN